MPLPPTLDLNEPLLWAGLVAPLLNLVLLLVWGIRRLFLEKATFRPTWSYVDLWLALQAIVLLLSLVVAWLFHQHPDLTTAAQWMSDLGVLLTLLFLQNTIFFAVPALLIAEKYQLPLREIGLPPLPRRGDLLWGVGLGLAAIVVSLTLETGLSALAEHFHTIPWVARGLAMDRAQPITPLIQAVTHQGWGVLLLGFLAIGPGPGLGEEMLFRGFLFNLLKRRLGLWPGVVLSGLLFAAVHGYFIGFLPVFLLGMALAVVYQRTGSLWTSILLHATNNGVQVLLAFLFPHFAR